MASLVLAIGFSAPATAQVDPANEQMMNLVMQIQQLQDEVRMLRGQLEEQAYELENIKRRQRDQYLDLDQRINEMRDGLPAVSGANSAARPGRGAGGAVLDGPESRSAVTTAASDAIPEDRPEVRPPVESQSAVTGLAQPEVASRAVEATPEMEQAAYDRAFQALKELRYADAAEEFQDFLNTYPDSEYADNAQYWLGESYYVTRNYEIALQSFQTLINRFPASAKAGDGLLKIGFTHYELKAWAEARAALEQVQEKYPNSTLSRLAESRLRSMRLEGHF